MISLYRDGKFWLVDSVTLAPITRFAPFATLTEAKRAAGDDWDEGGAEAHYGI